MFPGESTSGRMWSLRSLGTQMDVMDALPPNMVFHIANTPVPAKHAFEVSWRNQEEGRKRLELLKQREEKYMVQVHEDQEEEKKRKAGEDAERESDPSKVLKGASENAVVQIDDILGDFVSEVGGQAQSSSSSVQPVSQGGPSGVSPAIAGGSVEETDPSAGAGPSGVVDAEMEGVEFGPQQNMEIGVVDQVHRFSQSEEGGSRICACSQGNQLPGDS